MKKLLALVLALVMTLSLCVTSNAAYKDAADVDYNEAVDVMTALGVLEGDQNGNFLPDAQLTRAAAAKIVAYLLLGNKVAESLEGSGKVFSDVPASHWAAGYIEYLNSVGVVAGTGAGKFEPNGALTNAAFAKMLLVVLGCDADNDGLTGASWVVKTAKLAAQSKIFKGVDNSINAVATRQEAALYAFNAITKGGMYTAHTGNTTTVNGVTVVTGGSASEWNGADTASEMYAYANYDKLDSASATDDLGRPATRYFLNKTASHDGTYTSSIDTNIGVYTDDADYTFVLEKSYTKGDVLKNLKNLIDNDDLVMASSPVYKLNGATSNHAAVYAAMKLGYTVEVFMNADEAKQVDQVVAYNYTIMKVDKVSSYNKEDDMVTKYGASQYYTLKKDVAGDGTFEAIGGGYTYVDTLSKSKDNYQAIGTVAKGDLFAVVLGSDSKVLSMTKVGSVEGTVSATATGYVKVDGTKYFQAATDAINAGDKGTFYLDPNNMIIGKDLTASTTVADALYVVAEYVTENTTYGGGEYALNVEVVDMEGAVKTLVVKKAGSASNLNLTNYGVSGVAVGKFVKAEYNSTTKVNDLTAWDYDAAGFDGIDTASISYSNSSAFKKSSSKVGGIYVNADTKYIVVADDKPCTVTVADGGINYTLVSDDVANVIYKNTTGNKVAQYVVLDLDADEFTQASTSYTDLLYVDTAADVEQGTVKDSAGTSHTTYTYDVYDMTGAKKTITAIDNASSVGAFNSYAITSYDAYDLTAKTYTNNGNTSSVALTAKYDDEELLVKGQAFKSYYGTLLTTKTANFEDIETADAKIIDLRDKTASGAYAYTVDTLEAMKEAYDAGYNVVLDMYLKDGAKLVFVTDVTATPPASNDATLASVTWNGTLSFSGNNCTDARENQTNAPLVATANDSNATVAITCSDGYVTATPSGNACTTSSFKTINGKTFTITVTAEDGVTTATYYVNPVA